MRPEQKSAWGYRIFIALSLVTTCLGVWVASENDEYYMTHPTPTAGPLLDDGCIDPNNPAGIDFLATQVAKLGHPIEGWPELRDGFECELP